MVASKHSLGFVITHVHRYSTARYLFFCAAVFALLPDTQINTEQII